MTASNREAHILGMIDELAGEIGAYLAEFADEDQSSALPLAMMRLSGKLRRAWNEFVAGEYDKDSDLWVMS
jgi:hypothetical protein